MAGAVSQLAGGSSRLAGASSGVAESVGAVGRGVRRLRTAARFGRCTRVVRWACRALCLADPAAGGDPPAADTMVRENRTAVRRPRDMLQILVCHRGSGAKQSGRAII